MWCISSDGPAEISDQPHLDGQSVVFDSRSSDELEINLDMGPNVGISCRMGYIPIIWDAGWSLADVKETATGKMTQYHGERVCKGLLAEALNLQWFNFVLNTL